MLCDSQRMESVLASSVPCSFCCLWNRWRQWLIHSTNQAYPHPFFSPARRRICPNTAVSTQKIYFFTRSRPWLAGKLIFLPEHSRGRSKKQFFHPDTAMAGRKNNLFASTRPWLAGKMFFLPAHGCGRAKKPSFSPKTPIFLLNTQS